MTKSSTVTSTLSNHHSTSMNCEWLFVHVCVCVFLCLCLCIVFIILIIVICCCCRRSLWMLYINQYLLPHLSHSLNLSLPGLLIIQISKCDKIQFQKFINKFLLRIKSDKLWILWGWRQKKSDSHQLWYGILTKNLMNQNVFPFVWFCYMR